MEVPSDQIAIKISDQIAIKRRSGVDSYLGCGIGVAMSSDEVEKSTPQSTVQTVVDSNGNTIELDAVAIDTLADVIAKGGLFNDFVRFLRTAKATTIARSSGKDSKHNYQASVGVKNGVQGNGRMGAHIWVQCLVHGTDEEDIETLKVMFPNAVVKVSDRT